MKKRTTILTAVTITGLLLIGCAASAAQVKRLDMETAKNAAIKDAGFTSEEVTFHSIELDNRNGIEFYDVEFSADGAEYDYDIDALTGVVIGSEAPEAANKKSQNVAKTPEIVNEPTNELSEAEAKKIALDQIPGATEADIREWEVDYDDGRLEYEGAIWFEEMEYEFEIDGYSGAIRDWDVESIYD